MSEMNSKVTVVIDNCVPNGANQPFLGEHGLSMLLETSSKRVLLDTGQSSAVVHNLCLLGKSPASIDVVAISHGHYDHTGGLYPFLAQARKTLPVYAHEAAFGARFSVSAGGRKFVGIPHRREQLVALGANFHMIREPLDITPGCFVSGTVPRTTPFETGDSHLVTQDASTGCDCQDAILDDMVLYCRSRKGLVVISGCAHSGLVNIVRHGLALTGETRLHGWIGGTHLGPVSELQQDQTISELLAFAPDFVAANHCTGFHMMARLHQALGDRFIPAFVGTVVEF